MRVFFLSLYTLNLTLTPSRRQKRYCCRTFYSETLNKSSRRLKKSFLLLKYRRCIRIRINTTAKVTEKGNLSSINIFIWIHYVTFTFFYLYGTLLRFFQCASLTMHKRFGISIYACRHIYLFFLQFLSFGLMVILRNHKTNIGFKETRVCLLWNSHIFSEEKAFSAIPCGIKNVKHDETVGIWVTLIFPNFSSHFNL